MTTKTRIASFAFAFTALAFAGFCVGIQTAHAEGETEACTTKKFQVPRVEAACKKSGRAGAKDLMKQVVKDQKAAGNDINCKSCHESLKVFDLKSNAVSDLRKYLG